MTRALGKPNEEAKQRTAASAAGAASHDSVDGQAIEGPKAHAIVRRLQARLGKATQAGRWGKGQALPRLLTHSWSGKGLAVKRVTENPGTHPAGIDQVRWETPAKKAAAVSPRRQHGYRAQPGRGGYLTKANGKNRPLGSATRKDRALPALYLPALDPSAETRAAPNSYGFRPARSPADAIGHLHQVLSLPTGAQGSCAGDIRSCFDAISPEWLLPPIPREQAILRQGLKAGDREQSVWSGTTAGTPQGAICAPVLLHLTLDGLEAKLRDRSPTAPARRRRAKGNRARFAADFVLPGSAKERLETEVPPLVTPFFQERGLLLSPEKTKIPPLTDGFDLLGPPLRDSQGTILVNPSRTRVPSLRVKARARIRATAQATPGNRIGLLNPLSRGWANSPPHGARKQTLAKVDPARFWPLGQWATRRHPNKPRRGIKDKYFHLIGKRHGVCWGERPGKHGRTQRGQWFSATRVRSNRHPQIKGAANPYEPAWEISCAHRLGVTRADNLQGRRKLR